MSHQQHNPIIACVRCERRFRPTSPALVVCQVCVYTFAMTGIAPGDPVPVVESYKKAPQGGPRLIHYPTPRGICANEACRKPFPVRSNQRYCSGECRHTALDRRRRVLYGKA